eukprot:maker-scaffold323_size206388-snap-gene-1.15 protein:Tk12477 transcript:maker-scaffold323_size206388-snap-gene-1.15-mRNA-1 annotation:"Tankyrase-1"
MAVSVSESVSPLLEAVQINRTDIVKTLLDEVLSRFPPSSAGPDLSAFLNESRNEHGNFLHNAIQFGSLDVTRALLQMGANAAVRKPDGSRLLEHASTEVSKIMLTTMLQAVATSQCEQVEQLLTAGFDPNTVDGPEKRCSILHWAASFSDPHTVRVLVDHQADLNARDRHGLAPLHEALKRKSRDVAQILVKAGADLTLQATDGPLKDQSPLDMMRALDEPWALDLLDQIRDLTNNENGTHSEIQGDGTESQIQRERHRESVTPSLTSTQQALCSQGRLSPLPPVITDERLNLLWPQPQFMRQLNGEPLAFPNELPMTISPGVVSIHKIMDIFEFHQGKFRALDRRVFLNNKCPIDTNITEDHSSILHCAVQAGLFHVRGSYNLHISDSKIRIQAGDLEGIHFAIMTLLQMMNLFREEGLISVMVADQPACSVRAVLLDMNPFGRVPNFDVMIQLVDILGSLKINQLQAFIRLNAKESEWSFSFSKSDLLAIDRYCRDRFLDFIPAFDVFPDVTLADHHLVLRSKIHEILLCFDRPKVMHLGPVLSSVLFNSEDFARSMKLLFPNFEECIFFLCANCIPPNVSSIPSNTILLHYGFQKGTNFSVALNKFHDIGANIGICTGTGAWSNLSGSPENMLINAMNAHSALTKVNGRVSVMAHWCSDPALTHSVFAWPGFLTSAGLAWNPDIPFDFLESVLKDLLDFHIIGDLKHNWGQAVLDIGRAESYLLDPREPAATSVLLRILLAPESVDLSSLSIEKLGHVIQMVRRCQVQLKSTVTEDSRLEPILQELYLTSELLLVAAKIGRALCAISANEKPTPFLLLSDLAPTFKTDVANKLIGLVEQFKVHWISRYHEQGITGSSVALNRLLTQLVPKGSDVIL